MEKGMQKLPEAANYCFACMVVPQNTQKVRTDGAKGNYMVFNLDGDLTAYEGNYYDQVLFYTARGRYSGFVSLRSLIPGIDKKYGDGLHNKLLELRQGIKGGYTDNGMPPIQSENANKTVQVYLETFSREHPETNIAVNFKQKIYYQKQQDLIKLTDSSPFILPPDTAEIGYNFLPVFVMRGCAGHCTGCQVSGPNFRINSPENVNAQLKFFETNYPLSHTTYNGLLIAGEDPLFLKTKDLVDVMQRANDSFIYKGEFYSPLLLPENYYKIPGFAYMFASFKSLMKKNVEELKELKDAGLRWLNLGLESADEQVLKTHFQKQDLPIVQAGIEKLEKAGINYSLNVIVGFGDEKIENSHLEKTAQFIVDNSIGTHIYMSRFCTPDFKTDYIGALKSMRKFADMGVKTKNSLMPYPMIRI